MVGLRVILEEERVDGAENGGEVGLSLRGGGRFGRWCWSWWKGCFDRVDEGSETVSVLEVVG